MTKVETADRKRAARLPWPADELAHLSEGFKQTDSSRQHWQLHSKRYPGRSLEAIRHQCRVRGMIRVDTATFLATRPQAQRRLAWDALPRYNQFDRLYGSYAVSADWHVPMLDLEMVKLKAAVAKKHKIDRALILGDFLNADSFSHWVAAGLSPKNVEFKEELIYAAQAMEELLLAYPGGVHFLSGNHDERPLRVLRYALDLSDIYSLIGRRMAEGLRKQMEEKVKVSSYSFCHVNDSWLMVHPATYSKIPGAIARDIAEREHMHTMCGNGHLWALTREKSGHYWACDTGCMVDRQKVQYAVMKVKRFPNWVNGFTILKESIPYLYDREMAKAV